MVFGPWWPIAAGTRHHVDQHPAGVMALLADAKEMAVYEYDRDRSGQFHH